MFEKVKSFINESFEEVKDKVTWPTMKELQSNTVLVLVSALVFAIMIGLVDFVFENGMTWFYRSF
ncbi:MAG: preprotein translocase subunit SecE [Cytophagales bacterium]|nr:MAG: preprotein translocase subunit SecE [Cytophagales bacterium]